MTAATDMTALNWWTLAAGLIGAFLGAAGAIFAQVVSARFTARRETARLQFEKDKHVREMRAGSTELFFDSKRAAFVSALTQAQDMRDLLVDTIYDMAHTRGGDGKPPADFQGKWEDLGHHWRRTTAEVGLFDDSLTNTMNDFIGVLNRWVIWMHNEYDYYDRENFFDKKYVNEAIDRLRRTLHQSLEGSSEP